MIAVEEREEIKANMLELMNWTRAIGCDGGRCSPRAAAAARPLAVQVPRRIFSSAALAMLVERGKLCMGRFVFWTASFFQKIARLRAAFAIDAGPYLDPSMDSSKTNEGIFYG
jgi:hypothetical protein